MKSIHNLTPVLQKLSDFIATWTIGCLKWMLHVALYVAHRGLLCWYQRRLRSREALEQEEEADGGVDQEPESLRGKIAARKRDGDKLSPLVFSGPRAHTSIGSAGRAVVSVAVMILAAYSFWPDSKDPLPVEVQVDASDKLNSPDNEVPEIAEIDSTDRDPDVQRRLDEAERIKEEALSGLPAELVTAIRNPDADLESTIRTLVSQRRSRQSRSNSTLRKFETEIVSSLFSTSSERCRDQGYSSLVFGTRLSEIRTTHAVQGSGDHKWLGSEAGGLYFDNGKLRGVRKVYAHDVVGNTRAATELFGPPRRTDIFAFNGVTHDGDRREETLVHYRCPNIIAYVSINTYPQRLRNCVQFTVFDRTWLTQGFEREVSQRIRLLQSIRKIYDHFNANPTDWEGAPLLPNAQRVVGTSTGSDGQELHFVAYRSHNAKEALNVRFHRYYEDSLAEVIEFENGYIAIEVHGFCDKEYEPDPLFAYRDLVTEPSVIKQDVLRCNSIISQVLFPPKGNTIQTKPRHDDFLNFIMIHDWEMKSGWRVRIRDNNVFYLIRPGPAPSL